MSNIWNINIIANSYFYCLLIKLLSFVAFIVCLEILDLDINNLLVFVGKVQDYILPKKKWDIYNAEAWKQA